MVVSISVFVFGNQGGTSIKTENIGEFLNSMYVIADKYQGKFEGIAVCTPGKIDTKKKIIHFGGALPFLDGLNLEKTLGNKYHVPVGAENDGKDNQQDYILLPDIF